MVGRDEFTVRLLLALLIRSIAATKDVNWEITSELPIESERIGTNTPLPSERRNAKLAFERQEDQSEAYSFEISDNGKAIWYKMDKPRIVGKFSFRNSRDPGDRDNDPTEINFIASEDCTNQKIGNFKEIMTVKNLIWKFDDEEKSWIIPDLATKNMLIENKFICFGIKVLQTRGTKKAALQDLKIWILTEREVTWKLRRQLQIYLERTGTDSLPPDSEKDASKYGPKFAFQRQGPGTNPFIFNGINSGPKAIWYKLDRPEIVDQFSFRNGRSKENRDNDPLDFDFIASKDCIKWKTIKTITNVIWYTKDEEKSWRISNPAEKLTLMENTFNCYGIRVIKSSGKSLVALQDLKFWILNHEYFGNVMIRGLPVCDASWDDEAAKRVCTEMNFGKETKGVATNNGRFGKAPTSYINTEVGCKAKKTICDGFLNRAKGGVASYSSTGGTSSTSAFAGQTKQWHSKAGMPQWLMYKLEDPIPICKISFRPRTIGEQRLVFNDCPQSYRFEGSNDGINFETILSVDNEANAFCNPGDVFIKSFDNEKPFLFYRFWVSNVPGRKSSKYVVMGDLQFFSHNDIGVPKCDADWKARNGRDCELYEKKKYCTKEGGIGPGWKKEWGQFHDQRWVNSEGRTALVCPQCGCSTISATDLSRGKAAAASFESGVDLSQGKAEATLGLDKYPEYAAVCGQLANQADYRGKQNKTSSGKTCIKWSAAPNSKYKYKKGTVSSTGLGDHNYCRNPSKNPKGLWCYKSTTKRDYEFCVDDTCLAYKKYKKYGVDVGQDVAVATLGLDRYPKYVAVCGQLANKADYRGTQSKSISGKTCINWSAPPPKYARKKETFFITGIGDHNYCRNPSYNSKGPWCYVSPKKKGGEYEFCVDDTCLAYKGYKFTKKYGCCKTSDCSDYDGTKDTTASGKTCQPWSNWWQKYMSGLSNPENFCRNPNGNPDAWCHTNTSTKTWEYCNIPRCADDLNYELVDLSEGRAGATSVFGCSEDAKKQPKMKLEYSVFKRAKKTASEARRCGQEGFQASNAFKRAFMNSNGTGLKYESRPWMSDSTPLSSTPQIVHIQLPRAVEVTAFSFRAFPKIPDVFYEGVRKQAINLEDFTGSWVDWRETEIEALKTPENYYKHSPTKFDLVGSDDCNSGDWTTILHVDNVPWYTTDQLKYWEVPEEKRRPFPCIGFRVLENGWGDNAVIHGVKIWEKRQPSKTDCTYKRRKDCPGEGINGVICLDPTKLNLVNENKSESEGNVILQGYPICGIDWSTNNAQVVCNSLFGERFKDRTDKQVPVFEATGNSAFGPAPNNHFIMSNVRCKGNEKHLTDCPSNYYPQVSDTQRNCTKDQAAGVRCAKCTVTYLQDIIETVKGNSNAAVIKSVTTALKTLEDNCRAWKCTGTWPAYPEFCAVRRFLQSFHLMGRKENTNVTNRRIVSIKFDMSATIDHLIDQEKALQAQKLTIDALAELQMANGDFQKKLGHHFTTMASWDRERAQADLDLAQSILTSQKNQLENIVTKFGKGLNDLIYTAYTKAGFAVADKVAHLTLQTTAMYLTRASPAGVVNYGSLATSLSAIMSAAGSLADAVFDISQLNYLVKNTFPEFNVLAKNISANFKKNEAMGKEMNRILKINKIDDFTEEDAEKFLKYYRAFTPSLTTYHVARYNILITQVIDKTCEVLEKAGGGVVASSIMNVNVGACSRTKQDKKILIDLIGAIKVQELTVNFDCYARIAKAKLSINAAKSLQIPPKSLDALNKLITIKKSLFLYRMQKEVSINSACDLIKYRNFGIEESYCEKLRRKPDDDIVVLKKALSGSNADMCEDKIINKLVTIPAVAHNSTPIAEGTLDLATLLDPELSNSVEFQIPNRQWLVDNEWMDSMEVAKGPFYLTKFELFLPPYYAVSATATVELDLIKNTLDPHGDIDAFDEDVSFILKYRDYTHYCVDNVEFDSPYGFKESCASLPTPCREMRGEYQGQNIYPSLMSLWKVRLSVDPRAREVRPIDPSGIFKLKANVGICTRQSQRPEKKTATRNADETPTKCCDDKSIWKKYGFSFICKECPPNSVPRLHGFYCESCPAGFEPREAIHGEPKDQVWGCQPCKADFFKDSEGMKKCQQCPNGVTISANQTCISGIECCGQSAL